MCDHSFTLTVKAARDLSSKKKGSSYVEVVLLGKVGDRLTRARTTKPRKSCVSPRWDTKFVYNVDPKAFSGLFIRCWEKKSIRKDKCLGQLTVKVNPQLMMKGTSIDSWYGVTSRSRSSSKSSTKKGEIHLEMSLVKLGGGVINGEQGEDEESSVDEDVSHTGGGVLRLSHKYYDEDKTQDAVVVVEEETEEEEEVDGMQQGDQIRIGPQNPSWVKGKHQKISLSNKNREVRNTSSAKELVKANVSVSSGCWAFEISLLQGHVTIGWCTDGYVLDDASSGEFWGYACGRSTMVYGTSPTTYGVRCAAGDVIAAVLDVEANTLSFFRNTTPLGVAHSNVMVTNASDMLVPCVVVERGGGLKANFGTREGISGLRAHTALPKETHTLRCPLSGSQREQLSVLYESYRDVDMVASGEHGDAIGGDGAVKFQTDLGFIEEDDPIFLIISWKLQCENMFTITREEWMFGFTMAGVYTMDGIKEASLRWKKEGLSSKGFPSFFNFVFTYVKPAEQKYVLIEEVEVIWDMLIKPRGWALYGRWMEFLREKGQKYISKDVWQQFLEFQDTYAESFEGYDDTEAWPLLFDEFVEHIRGDDKANGDDGEEDDDVW